MRRIDACSTPRVSRDEARIGAGLTLGSALIVALIMVIGRSPVTESIGIVMTPGVLAIGPQWIYLGDRSRSAKVARIAATFLVLFVIGLAVGLTQK